MLSERTCFARVIGNLIRLRSKDLIWIDETTYSSVSLKPKAWSGNPVCLNPKQQTQRRITVMGAISPALVDGRCMRLAKSTNKAEYKDFLVDVYQSVLKNSKKPGKSVKYLVMDGHRSHTNADV